MTAFRIARLFAAVPALGLFAAGAANAQDTTYVGGPDAGGNDNVSVNLDVVGGGQRGSASAPAQGNGTENGDLRFDLSGGGTDAADVKPGEVVRGPGGAKLRFPLLEPPESHLTVDMARFAPAQQPSQKPAAPAPERAPETPDREPAPKDEAPKVASGQDQAGTTQTAAAPSRNRPASEPDAGGTGTGVTDDKMTGSEGAAPENDTAAGSGTGSTAGTDTRETANESGPVKLQPAGEKPDAPDRRASESAGEAAPTTTPETKPAESKGEGAGEPAGTTETQTADMGAEGGTASQAGDGMAAETGGDTAQAATSESAEAGGDETASGKTTSAETGSGDSTAGDTTSGDTTSGETKPGETKPGETQTAKRTTGPGADGTTRLTFAQGSAELSGAAKRKLDAIVQRLKNAPNRRIELTSYADAAGDSPSRSRRLSLSRALAVRSYLIEQGIRSTRIDVRALGNAAEDGPADRVDIAPASTG